MSGQSAFNPVNNMPNHREPVLFFSSQNRNFLSFYILKILKFHHKTVHPFLKTTGYLKAGVVEDRLHPLIFT